MVTMVGENPIEHYYPDGFGELQIVSTNALDGCMDWIVGPNISFKYDGGSAPRPIFENTQIGVSISGCDSPSVRVGAAYRRILTPTGNPSIRPTSTQPACPSGGLIKYAYISGKMPSTLTFDIDTGNFSGCIPELDTFLSKDELGSEMTAPRPKTEADASVEATYGFNYGDQPDQKYDETNYASGGSATLYGGGFPTGVGIPFIARAFDSTDPTVYIDGRFVLEVLNNWSSDRDSLILNIRNQMYLNGKPVTNREYLNTRKQQGYFADCCGCPCEE